MADNTPQNGTAIIAADDIASVLYQRVKPVWGVDGVANDTSATNPFPVDLRGATLAVTATAATGVAATATLPAPGAGLFHYITALSIDLYSTAARTGSATPIVVTSTNLPGSLAWTFSTAGAIGAIDRYSLLLTVPLRSSTANTATTIAAPVVTGGIWRINVSYYTAA